MRSALHEKGTNMGTVKQACRRVLPLLLVFALLLPLAPSAVLPAEAVTQADIDELRKKSADLNAQRQEVQSKLASLRAEKGKLTDQKTLLEDDIDLIQQNINAIQEEINAIQAQIDQIQTEIDALDVQIADYEAQIAQKQAELDETEAKERNLYELFCQRVQAMEEQGEVSYWSILFSSESFSDLLDNFIMIQEFMDYDNEVMEELLDLQAQITSEKEAIEALKAELEAAKAQLEESKAQQQAKKDEQEAAKQQQIAAQNELKVQEDELQKLINDLSLTEDELEAQEASLRQAASAADAEIRKLEQQMQPVISTVVSEGSFAWPLPGRTTLSSLFGGRIHPITGKPNSHSGIDIPAPYGTSIRCAKSGVVTISARHSSYGNYVAVSHSDGTSTLYAHMSSRSVTVGQQVAQGQELGKVGSTGSSTGNHLHFEIRVNNVRVDPVNYFSGLTVSARGQVRQLN